MKKILTFITLALAVGAFSVSCDYNEEPKSSASVDMMFSSEGGLQTYMYGFYENLPSRTGVYTLDSTTDYGPKNSVGGMEVGAYTVSSATSWSWSALRNINFFLEKNVNENVPQKTRDNYNGIARLFRAYFYFDKLVTYGPVPWIDWVFNSPEDERLMNTQDTRDVIIGHIIEDLDFAFNNIIEAKATLNSSLVNKWTAMALKSRVCLFEAAWRKYHAGDQLDIARTGCTQYKPNDLYALAADAAKKVMDSGVYSIYTGTKYANGRGAYRQLFIADNTVTQEVILAIVADETLCIGEQNWWYNSSTYGPHLGMSRKFAKTYLNSDGTPYNEKNEDGTFKTFKQETTGRDTRLNETIRGWDYTRKNALGAFEATAANFTGHTLSGYQVTKWVIDDILYDDHSSNGNDEPLIRYAEMLLNYAEAKAELGTLTDGDWEQTIGTLRKRAGITGGTPQTGTLTSKPTEVEPYIASYYPGVTDPVILEIRRERAIELAYEGLRMTDLKRWACCNLWVDDPWEGIFVPAMDEPLDINGDGTNDVYFTYGNIPDEYKGIGVKVGKGDSKNDVNLVAQPEGGYIMKYLKDRDWPQRQYLYPIPETVIQKNPNLKQNPGW